MSQEKEPLLGFITKWLKTLNPLPEMNIWIRHHQQIIEFDPNTKIPFNQFLRLKFLEPGKPMYLKTIDEYKDIKVELKKLHVQIGRHQLKLKSYYHLMQKMCYLHPNNVLLEDQRIKFAEKYFDEIGKSRKL